jgi:uncharacterized low-complexity protein
VINGLGRGSWRVFELVNNRAVFQFRGETGKCETGKCETGKCETGKCETGKCETGKCETGKCETGKCERRECEEGMRSATVVHARDAWSRRK